MRLCVLQSLLASASGVILRARHPGQPQRERLIPALGAKPREAHSAACPVALPPSLRKAGSMSPVALFGFASIQLGGKLMWFPFAGVSQNCKLKPTLGGIASDVGQGRQWCLACLY